MYKLTTAVLIGITLLALGCNKSTDPVNPGSSNTETPPAYSNSNTPEQNSQTQQTDFSKLNPTYKFSADIRQGLKVEYIPASDSINIYDPNRPGDSSLEKSVIFIRNFNANDFLTLSTVNILNRSDTVISGHAAVRYEIQKKNGIPNFPNQPSWRSGQHKLIDIRYTKSNPSPFFVFSYNPDFLETEFNTFINSLKFFNDSTSLRYPIPDAKTRITKKPFGLYVSPTNSPVNPERFTGFHNAVDFEVLPGEENIGIPVTAICGGPIVRAEQVSGYGGLIVQTCSIQDSPVTVLYGHINLTSMTAQIATFLSPGDFLADLGKGYSSETGGERKHLHLGIRKGGSADIRGYVPGQSNLNDWLDFTKLIVD